MPEIPKTYEPQKYEDKIYALWEKSGKFNPDNLKLPKNAKSYTIVLPPPNITDKLHLGHASIIAIEDLLIRFHRMKGFRALYLPGTDHASIATQNVVEKKLLKEQGLTRHDLGREKFLKEVWKFLRVTQATILKQARKMGGSFDWSREAFTLDVERKRAVTKMFLDMHKEGLVYRGKRIVNWCPRCKSTLADDEVEYKEEIGKLYWIKYGPFVLATSRPETKLGDTAVAVYPGDKRYAKMVGKKFMIPGVLGEFEITVVADKAVDPKFGSGAIKVTPGHDFTDYAIAQRHNIAMKQIIDEDGKMMANCGKYTGMTTLEARKAIAADMEKMGLIDHVEEGYKHNLAICYRCGTTIEPIPSEQWFLAVDKKLKRLGGKSLKEKALEVAKNGKIKFHPHRFTKRYADWMSNLHDWCISRQIWFGHEFPVWYRDSEPTYAKAPAGKQQKEIYVGEKAPRGKGWTKDPDTFDTWFSSGMWSFSTLGWPACAKASAGKPGKIIKTGDLARFHPTQVLETGYEILTLWVSRMIMMSLFALNEIPFENVYLHGMVLDSLGKKMSKSKGNGIDPMDMIEKFGTDAVRLSLLIGSTPGNDMRLSEEKIASFRNFVTKLWNIYRYCNHADSKFSLVEKINKKDLKSLSDRWLVSQLQKTIEEITRNLNEYKFSMAGEALEKFIWNDFADWYLEINKIEKNSKVLGYVLDKILKLSHPFAPFVTEKIWQDSSARHSFSGGGSSVHKILMVEKWPVADKKLLDKKSQVDFAHFQQTVTKIRNIRTNYHIDPGKTIQVFAKKAENKEVIEKLARIKIDVVSKINAKGIVVAGKNIKLTLAISDLIDVEKEKARLEKEIANLKSLVTKTEALLSNKNFVKSAPKEIILVNQTKLKEYGEKLKIQQELLKNCTY
ncbi:MAG: valine--tRNA ligase [Candidatus Moranbacteria bacterium]|nr:valine--tRNA ligase [Candidatus Moranbacteria bacterium]